MAKFQFALGAAFGVQSALGSINTTIRGLSGALGVANGIVLGRREGLGNTGISIAYERISEDVQDVTGSYTKQFNSFLRSGGTFSITTAIRGAGNAATAGSPVDADMDLATTYPGLDALLNGVGIDGAAWGSGVGWVYTPISAIPLTGKFWHGDTTDAFATVYSDCMLESVTKTWTPGGVGVYVFSGRLGSYSATGSGATTFPTFTFGTLASVATPVVESAGFIWGAGGSARGCRSVSITINTGLDDIEDMNVVGGIYPDQSERTVSADVEVFADTADVDYEFTELIRTAATTDDLSFTIGTAAVALGAVLAYRISFNNPIVQNLEPGKAGARDTRIVKLLATGATANSEYEMRLI